MVSVLLMEKLDLFIGCHHKKVTVFDEIYTLTPTYTHQ